jgi:hypothetical protein
MVRAATHTPCLLLGPGLSLGGPSVPFACRVLPGTGLPERTKERSNAFAADNSTEWTQGPRNLTRENGLGHGWAAPGYRVTSVP